ncbi:MAG: N-6 DNA methylase [Defluviitaleaceae bacterium]|nr:N-6 DNA methylase [Defluviitaleaceae bacterium]
MGNSIDYIKQGEQKGLIRLSDDMTTITYLHQGITRNYSNPEEKVQANTFCKLVLLYNYPESHIRQFVSTTKGSDGGNLQIDIVVYNDEKHKSPHIVVECKKEDISEQEFTQAINQAFSYAHNTAGTLKYVWTTSGIKDVYHKFDKENETRETVSDIPQYGVKKLNAYKYAYNGGMQGGQKLFPLETVTESFLTNVFKQAHQALWGGGELNPSEAFDELDKLIFCKIFDEKKPRRDGDHYDFQVITVEPENDTPEAKEKAEAKTNEELLKRIKDLYEEGRKLGERKNDTEIFKDDIKLNAGKTRTVVSYLQGIDLLNTDLDSKGRAFETFMGSFFRGDFGQYFTPRTIVGFIVDSLPITNESVVLDTSCGSGGFLLHALYKVRGEANRLYPNHQTDVRQGRSWWSFWHDFAEHNLFGIEINEQIARTAKMNMIIHDDGHTNVVAADGLLSPQDLRKRTDNKGFKEGGFDFIITNPPFGSTIKQTEKAYLHQYSLATKDVDWLNPASKASDRPSQSTEVLFIEQAEVYLREGGYLAIVIPDGILTNSSMQYVRDYIGETFRIVAVISMPQTAFSATGAGVKSSVMFLKKHSKQEKQHRQNTKLKTQSSLLGCTTEGKELHRLLDEKKKELAKQAKQIKVAEKLGSDNVEELKSKRQQASDDFDEKIEKIREALTENYDRLYKGDLTDYPIFMAIAEDIGYDATGKETGKNELEEISKELARFITAIEEGDDRFFR